MNIRSLHVYPLKGGRAIDLSFVGFDQRGLLNDRRYMLVSEAGNFLSQREVPELAQIEVEVKADGINLIYQGDLSLQVKLNTFGERMPVIVWRSTVDALVAPDPINHQLSAWLDRPVKLVHMDATAERLANPNWTGKPAEVSFADGYPMLITCAASLEALNNALVETAESVDAALPMNRFRPNIVIETDEPWIEDTWKRLQIGTAVFELVKPCDRCVVTTHDQRSGLANSNEPVATLMKLRRSAHPEISGVLFGINSVPVSGSSLSVGEDVRVLEFRQQRWPLKQA